MSPRRICPIVRRNNLPKVIHSNYQPLMLLCLLALSIQPNYADALEARQACAVGRVDGGHFGTLWNALGVIDLGSRGAVAAVVMVPAL